MNVRRYLQTLVHLRPVQVYGRVLFRLKRPAIDARPAPALAPITGRWQHWAWREPAMVGMNRFRFLGVEHEAAMPGDWDDPSRARLWTYNLHYFDDLTASGAVQRRGQHRVLVRRWHSEVGPGQGNGWEPYPISLRVVNWIKADLDARLDNSSLLDSEGVQSLALQLRYLSGRLESHLLGNHLWANAKALLIGGLRFGGEEGAAWRRLGARIMSEEIAEQILADGGHFERSPMYHAIMTEDVLDLLRFAAAYPDIFPQALRAQLARVAPMMLRWLRVMSHPDGEIALFNDAAFGIAPRSAQLEAYAAVLQVAEPTPPLGAYELLPQSGYARLTLGRAVVICDAAALGPDYLPGHGHADTLSFEFSLDGTRLLVNGGTSVYAEGPVRERERSTESHNTVVVDGTNSSDVWRSFRVGARAKAAILGGGVNADEVWFEGAHDGYRALPGHVTHSRRWTLREGALIVRDRVDGSYVTATSVLRTPAQARRLPTGSVALSYGTPTTVCELRTSNASVLREDTWSPVFGAPEPARRVDAPLVNGHLETSLLWA